MNEWTEETFMVLHKQNLSLIEALTQKWNTYGQFIIDQANLMNPTLSDYKRLKVTDFSFDHFDYDGGFPSLSVPPTAVFIHWGYDYEYNEEMPVSVLWDDSYIEYWNEKINKLRQQDTERSIRMATQVREQDMKLLSTIKEKYGMG